MINHAYGELAYSAGIISKNTSNYFKLQKNQFIQDILNENFTNSFKIDNQDSVYLSNITGGMYRFEI